MTSAYFLPTTCTYHLCGPYFSTHPCEAVQWRKNVGQPAAAAPEIGVLGGGCAAAAPEFGELYV
jgi:hypothetical protein